MAALGWAVAAAVLYAVLVKPSAAAAWTALGAYVIFALAAARLERRPSASPR